MAAWMGDPTVDGNPTGWALSRVVHAPDDAGTGDLAATAGHWVLRRRRSAPSAGHVRDGGSHGPDLSGAG
ncbi:unnamed protein product [Lampetra planeri]